MKRNLLIIILLFAMSIPSMAVLKEKDLPNTLSILRVELTKYRQDLLLQSGVIKEQQEKVMVDLMDIMNKSEQNSLMLYSQKNGYIFDLTYACHQATEMYHRYQEVIFPFKSFMDNTTTEIARYDSLVNVLSEMHTRGLSDKAKIDRNVCLTLSINILRTLKENNEQFKQYIDFYKSTSTRLRSLNDYANKRYADIQASIFNNAGTNYIKVLSNFKFSLKESALLINDKYRPLHNVNSQWDSRLMIGLLVFIAFWGLVSVLLNVLLVRGLFTKILTNDKWALYYSRWFKKDNAITIRDSFMVKRHCIVLTTTVITFAAILGLIRLLSNQNFIIMASELLVEYTWLLGVIFISLLIRLSAKQISDEFRIYTPLITIDFIVITFRIILIPNELVNFLLPPILIIWTFWQWYVIKKLSHNLPRYDLFFSYITLIVFIAALISSWSGYTLLSVELLIWWIMQLTCILTITCIGELLRTYGERRNLSEASIGKTWFFDLLNQVVLPVFSVLSIILSVYWAADVFNLSDTTWHLFNKPFLNSKNISMSFFSICLVVMLYFLFAYINKTLKKLLLLHFERKDKTTAASKNTMAKNVTQVIVWGLWLIAVLSLFHVNNTWLVVVSGGLSTGIGFAMKDILENIYYGISLMMGRIKVGDWIECDGVRGKVSSISYTFTQIDTIDGSIIAFQNSQLFSKNYKNLTKNHGYELAIIPIGVAYGSDAAQVKDILYRAVSQVSCRDRRKEVKVVFTGFGDNSIDFKVIVWVPVLTNIYAEGTIMEAMYNALNEHGIEIPYPQRDVHIINDKSIQHADSENEAMDAIKKDKEKA